MKSDLERIQVRQAWAPSSPRAARKKFARFFQLENKIDALVSVAMADEILWSSSRARQENGASTSEIRKVSVPFSPFPMNITIETMTWALRLHARRREPGNRHGVQRAEAASNWRRPWTMCARRATASASGRTGRQVRWNVQARGDRLTVAVMWCHASSPLAARFRTDCEFEPFARDVTAQLKRPGELGSDLDSVHGRSALEGGSSNARIKI